MYEDIPTRSRPPIRSWCALLVLFTAGLIVSGYVDFAIRGQEINAFNWGSVLGRT